MSRIGGTRRCSGVVALGVIAIVLLLAATGCGGGGGTTGGGGSGGSTTGAEAGGSAAKGVEGAEAAVAPLMRRPTSVGKVEPLPKIGKASLTYVKCGVPVCEEYVKGAEEASAELGLSIKVLAAGNSPQEQTKAWDQAVLESPGAVLENGFELSLFEKQLAELKSKGIPVVSSGDTVAGTFGGEVVADIQPPSYFHNIGVREANYVIAESDGKANILFVAVPEVPLLGAILEGFEETIEQSCPECQLATETGKLEDIGRDVPGQIVSYMQKNPDVDWIDFAFGDMVAGVPEALAGAGIEGVKITSGGGSKVNWAYIKEGKGQVMDLAADDRLAGWWMVDRAVRAIAGEKFGQSPELPQQYLTQETIDFDINHGWTAVPDFQEQFIQGWQR